MKISVFLLITIFAFVIISCGPTDEDRARFKLNNAKILLEKQDTTAALLLLDSIAPAFPKAQYSKNAAKNLITEINFDLLHRKESMLDTLTLQIAMLEKNFDKEKTDFDRFTQYIHKRQNFQRAWNRSFIQVHLDERGDLFISSNYHGSNLINHVGLRVYDGGDDAKTDTIPLGSPDNHQSDFMEYKWEKVSYRNGKDNGVIEFIANHADRKLKAVFLGKGQYYIILEDYDKIAVKDALALSNAIKGKIRLEKEIQALKKKLNIS